MKTFSLLVVLKLIFTQSRQSNSAIPTSDAAVHQGKSMLPKLSEHKMSMYI